MNKNKYKNIINKYKTKYSYNDWYKYYREILKQYLLDYYNINNLTANVICSNLIPIDCNIDIFAINTNNNKIFLLLWDNAINVSKEVDKYLN